MRGSRSTRASSPSDLLCTVAERPKDLIALRGWRAAKKRVCQKGIDVFPDNFSFFGDFEEAAEGRLSNECIAVWEALGVAHARREKIPSRLILVLPDDQVCGGIDLDHSRIGYR